MPVAAQKQGLNRLRKTPQARTQQSLTEGHGFTHAKKHPAGGGFTDC
jgi:hypothetical protein